MKMGVGFVMLENLVTSSIEKIETLLHDLGDWP